MPFDLSNLRNHCRHVGVRDLPQSVVTVALPSAYETRTPVEGGNKLSSEPATSIEENVMAMRPGSRAMLRGAAASVAGSWST